MTFSKLARGEVLKVAVLQSNYLPWKGYFDIIQQVDLFVFYDDVQFTKNDWRNRNRIKTANGLQWLTVPVGQDIRRRIDEVEIPESRWQRKHWQAIQQSYQKAPHYSYIRPFLEDLLLKRDWRNLSELNQYAIQQLAADMLGCKARFARSSEYSLSGAKTERLLELLLAVNATHYLSGPSAKSYLSEQLFEAAGIALEYIDYGGYPEYDQLYPPFDHHVSIIDLLAAHGPDAGDFLKR